MNIPCKFSNKLKGQQIEFFQSFFRNCPQVLVEHIILKSYPQNHTLIHTDDPCSYIYILLDGRLQAIEEKATENSYDFTEISAIEILGDFELFTEETNRIITITTLEQSDCLIIPSIDYFSWIKKDASALFIRTQMLIKQLTKQTRFERQMLFIDNNTRMLYFLYSEYKRLGKSLLNIKHTRVQIANKLGCSVRTINRSILYLQKERLLSLSHGKIQVNNKQFELIQMLINSKNN